MFKFIVYVIVFLVGIEIASIIDIQTTDYNTTITIVITVLNVVFGFFSGITLQLLKTSKDLKVRLKLLSSQNYIKMEHVFKKIENKLRNDLVLILLCMLFLVVLYFTKNKIPVIQIKGMVVGAIQIKYIITPVILLEIACIFNILRYYLKFHNFESDLIGFEKERNDLKVALKSEDL